MEALADAMAAHGVPISASQCWRICKSLDLKPWQVESWMTSHDPDFWEKAADVCGLYLNPPENAIVWSVDEKTSIQAKARINPSKPAVPGYPERREFEYERNGTVVLFAGLDVHQGDVAGWVTDSTCSDNFVTFLWDLMDQTPDGTGPALHRRQLERAPDRPGGRTVGVQPQGAPALHADPCQLAQPGRAVLFHLGTAVAAPRRVRLGRRADRAHHRLHQGLQPPGGTVPVDLRGPSPQGRVSHND